MKEIVITTAEEVVKVSPPLTVVGLSFFDYAIADIVQITTFFYIVLQIGWLFRKMYKEEK